MKEITRDRILKLSSDSGLGNQSLKNNGVYPTCLKVEMVADNARGLAGSYRLKIAELERRVRALESFSKELGGVDDV